VVLAALHCCGLANVTDQKGGSYCNLSDQGRGCKASLRAAAAGLVFRPWGNRWPTRTLWIAALPAVAARPECRADRLGV